MNMTPNEINIAIAELIGWKRNEECQLPNYHGDLNACAEFEATLKRVPGSIEDSRVMFGNRLFEVVTRAIGRVALTFDIAHATAPQRCEAFLRLKRPELFKQTHE